MCMQDIDIARQTKTNVYSTTTSVNIPANQMRLSVRIIITQVDFALLSAVRAPINGVANPLNVPLAVAAWVQEAAVATTDAIQLQRDVRLEDVGDILLGDLKLTCTGGTNVFAIETYLEVVTPRSLDVTKLPK